MDGLGDFNPSTLKGVGECKLTGVYSDEWLIDGAREAYFSAPNINCNNFLERIHIAALSSWKKEADEAATFQYTDEAVNEACGCNGYEFYMDGRLFVENKA